MKNFIEVTVGGIKRLVNVNTISVVSPTESGATSIILLSTLKEGESRGMIVSESYDNVKNLIQESL